MVCGYGWVCGCVVGEDVGVGVWVVWVWLLGMWVCGCVGVCVGVWLVGLWVCGCVCVWVCGWWGCACPSCMPLNTGDRRTHHSAPSLNRVDIS